MVVSGRNNHGQGRIVRAPPRVPLRATEGKRGPHYAGSIDGASIFSHRAYKHILLGHTPLYILFGQPHAEPHYRRTHFIVRRSQHVTLHEAAVATSTGRCGSHAAAGASRAAVEAPRPPSQTVAEPASSKLYMPVHQRRDPTMSRKNVVERYTLLA